MNIEKKIVKIEMNKQTFKKVSNIKSMLFLKSEADAVKISIDIALILINAINEGKRVLIINKDESKTIKLILPHN